MGSHLERSPRACCPSPHHGDEGDEGHEGDEGRPQGDDGRCGRPKDRRGHAPQAEGREGVLAALNTIAYAEVKKTEKFAIPQLVMLKLKHKPARKAGKRLMFGKEVKVAAKPASKVVKAFAASALK